MRLIDVDELKEHKFLTPDAEETKKWLPAETQGYQLGWNDCIDAIVDNAPTVDFEKLGECLNCQIRAEYGSCGDCELSCPRNELINLLNLERPAGHWIFRRGTICGGYYKCNKCGEVERAEKNYCPNCGACMIKEAENDG